MLDNQSLEIFQLKWKRNLTVIVFISMKQTSCPYHPNNFIFCINSNSHSAQFLCSECLVKLPKENPNQLLRSLIHINQVTTYSIFKAQKDPIYLLNQIREQENHYDYFEIFIEKYQITYKMFKDEVILIINQLNQMVQQFESYFQKIIESVQILLSETSQVLVYSFQIPQYQSFQKFIIDLENSNKNQDIIKEIEKQLFQYLLEQKQNENINQWCIKILEAFDKASAQLNFESQNYEQLQSKMNKILNLSKQMINQTNNQFKIDYPLSNICESFYFKKLRDLQFYNTKYIPILYQDNDNFNIQQFWEKINQKSNLLMIFKSEAGIVFGGYSATDIKISYGGFEELKSSFIFCQNLDQIWETDLQRIGAQTEIYNLVIGEKENYYFSQNIYGTFFELTYFLQNFDLSKRASGLYDLICETNIQKCEVFQIEK